MANLQKKSKAPAPKGPPAKPPARHRVPTAKAKALGKKKKRDNSDSSEDSSDDIIIDDSEIVPKTGGVEVDWKDPQLSVKLLAIISEDADIKRSLYPPCGPNASTQKGGGKPKVNAQWEVAVALLGDIEKYKDAIAACDTPKEKLVFANKIKNRLSSMAKTTRDYDKVMGATGAGIKNAADINKDSKTNSRLSGPRSLPTAPAPEPVPTGLGHSNTPVADGVIMPDAVVNDSEIELAGQEEEEDDDDETSSIPIDGWEATPRTSPEPTAHKRPFEELRTMKSLHSPIASDVAKDDDAEMGGRKVKAKATKTRPRNSAKPATSKPAAPESLAAVPKPTKKTKLAEFSDIAKNEEKTHQKELELAQLRMRQQIKALEVKGRFLEKREDRRQLEKQAKRDERMQKLKLKELKLRQAHELKMAATKTGSTSATSHAASLYDSHSRASGSHYSSSEAADYADADYDGFNMNGMAGPSH
ncbi:hypothetical protein B0H13DRAFT_2678286 [Mycena leptocephala]|nr:hypothetical protein B0H13DRAFT_2678286 [Mycena leptocephala]